LIFTTLIEPSLWQLQQAWRELDSARHTLDFLPATNYQALCQTAGMRILKAEAWQHEMHFPTIPTLLQHFKTTGTSLPKTNCSQGLGGKKSLHALTSAYPRKDAKASFPLSYHPLLLMAKKDFLHG